MGQSAFFLCAFAALREISYATGLPMIDGGKPIAELVSTSLAQSRKGAKQRTKTKKVWVVMGQG
jgi:hypothetical protein